MTKISAGKQLDSQDLYEQQKFIKSAVAPAIIADNLRTPGNIASIFRLADAMNVERIFFLTRPENNINIDRIIQRHSRNSTHVNSIQLDHQAFLKQSKQLPPLFAIELTSHATALQKTRLPENCCLVIGSERYGVSDEILKLCESAAYIPMYGVNGSMNVSHALAISLYEWHRQHDVYKD